MYSLCDTLESSDAVDGLPRSFLRFRRVCVFEFYIHYIILTDSHVHGRVFHVVQLNVS